MRLVPALVLCLLALPRSSALADEGMWTFDAFPSAAVKKAYGFAPTEAWLDHVRLGSVRLAGGCSASFVSSEGLVMTNHHCVRSCIEQLSSPKEDLLARGFVARELANERRCPTVEVNQLVAIHDVTAKLGAATAGKKGSAFNKALKGAMSELEQACAKGDAARRCDVVTLFQGGKYHLYEYRRFQDVRLAFAPEFPMAAFGGDPDNFNFPRFGLDAAFLRVWSGGKPLQTEHWLKWSQKGAAEDELVFVAGHPGGTERLASVAELEYQRDVVLPGAVRFLAEYRGRLAEFQLRSPEARRVSSARLRSVENGLKALTGRHRALAEPGLLEGRLREETSLRQAIAKDPKLAAEVGTAFEDVRGALERARSLRAELAFLEGREGFQSELFAFARQLVRAAAETPKPNAERLREFTDGRLPALEQDLERERPISRELEILTLSFSLDRMRSELGVDHPVVKAVLGKSSPLARARSLVKGTKLSSAAVRSRLFGGGQKAVDASGDPMVLLARAVDDAARSARKRFEDEVESVLSERNERIARAHFAVHGTGGYPDATFTLRLSYGRVKGWKEADRTIPPFTTFAGAFDRHTGEHPFELPRTWLAAKPKLEGTTPFNMATTNDIIGGNSGSPMVNRAGEVVGLVFDGNLPSLGGRYRYDAEKNRATAVHSEAILAALRDIYGATRILEELRPVRTTTQQP